MTFRTQWPATVLSAIVVAACGSEPIAEQNLVEVVARGLTFEAPDEIPAGWTTFRFQNASPMLHLALVQRLPDGKGVADHQAAVAPIFQEGMDLLRAGDLETAMAKFGELPEWFGDITFVGGPGFVSAGGTAVTTVHLEPGTYVLECYVKTGGIFHSYNPNPDVYGMVHQFTVTGPEPETAAPEATVRLTLSSERGIEGTNDMTAGQHIVAVYFDDQTTYEHFLGHDVHLVRLAEDTDLDHVAAWMDWRQPEGLETPAPATFVGGTNPMPAGATAYLDVQLTPGRYAWIAQVPNAPEKGMLKVFAVAGAGGG